jgi:UDP-2-acetamido-3-amino-2,3-dideoxy-glucuronate N-acetyltransferase
VVTKNLPDYALIVGNPGRQTDCTSEFGHKLTFNSDNFAVCEESKQEYMLENNIVKRIK